MTVDDPWAREEAYQYMHRNSPGQGEPSFESQEMLEKVWGRRWGLSNDVGKLRTVLVGRPGQEWDVMMSGGEYVDKAQARNGM